MKTIWKFEINPVYPCIEMPKNANILTVSAKGDSVCMWAIVDTDAEKEKRYFYAYGTGQQMEKEGLQYIGTGHLMNDNLVFHVFEKSGAKHS